MKEERMRAGRADRRAGQSVIKDTHDTEESGKGSRLYVTVFPSQFADAWTTFVQPVFLMGAKGIELNQQLKGIR
jgi:hypothetical protein